MACSISPALHCIATEIMNCLPKTLENLHLDIVNSHEVGKHVVTLLQKIAKNFYNIEGQRQSIMLSSEESKRLEEITKLLLDLTWEHLNTGHWKDVSLSWRYLYSYTSLFRVLGMLMLTPTNLQVLVRTCDMGLLMGAPVLNNILAKVASVLAKEFHRTSTISSNSESSGHVCKKRSSSRKFPTDVTIPIEVCPSLEHFSKEYYLPQRPVLIRDSLQDWPSLTIKPWSVDYLLQVAGCRTIPVEIGSKYTDNSWAQKLMTMEEFVHTYIANEMPPSVGYCAQHQLLDQICELSDDIFTPIYCFLGEEEPDVHCWFGPGGTVSPLHFDPKHNCLAQVFGEKYIRLYSPESSFCLYPHDSALLNNTSQVDLENPDSKQFPLFEQASYLECILKPGDLLYIPPRWWHFVRSLDNSFSVSFWFS